MRPQLLLPMRLLLLQPLLSQQSNIEACALCVDSDYKLQGYF